MPTINTEKILCFIFISVTITDNKYTQGTSDARKRSEELRGFSPQANYTDRKTASCRRS
jgi:hypothetical protein